MVRAAASFTTDAPSNGSERERHKTRAGSAALLALAVAALIAPAYFALMVAAGSLATLGGCDRMRSGTASLYTEHIGSIVKITQHCKLVKMRRNLAWLGGRDDFRHYLVVAA